MTDHDEAIDRLLDELAAGGTPNESSLDAQSVNAAARLFAAGQGPKPAPAFCTRLESMLLEQKPAAAGSAPRVRQAGFGIALQPGFPRWRPRTMLATAAILALALLSALSVVRLGDSPNGGNATLAGVFQAASASAHSGESACADRSQAASIDIKLDDRPISLPKANVTAGAPFTLSVANHGNSSCGVAIEELNLLTLVEPGQTTSLHLNLEAGIYVLRIVSPSGDDVVVAGVIRSIDADLTATPTR